MSGKGGADVGYFLRLDMSTSTPTVVWQKGINCPDTNSCDVAHGAAFLSSDKSVVYSSNIIGGATKNLVFTRFNATNGDLIGVHYASSIACSAVYEITIVNEHIYTTVACSGSKVLKYDESLDTFTVYSNTVGSFIGFVRGIPSTETR